MSKKIYTHDEVIEILKKKKGKRSLAEFAKDFGIHRQTIWYILHGKQLPTESVGFKKLATYHTFERVEEK